METKEDKPLKNGEINGKDPKTGKFLPGWEGGPGKPKGTKHFNTLFKELLMETVELKDPNGKKTKMTMLKAMGLAMTRKAIRGDVSAFNAVSDRLDGKPNQSIDMEIKEAPVPIFGGRSTKPKTGKKP